MAQNRLLMISTHGYVASKPQLGERDTGGQVVYVLELSKALAARGFDVDIVTRRFEDRQTVEPVADRVRILRVPFGGNKFRPKEEVAQFIPEFVQQFLCDRTLSCNRYAAISSHYWDAGMAGVSLAKYLGIPHIHTPHSMGLLKRKNRAWGEQGETLFDNVDQRINYERVIYHKAELIVSTAGEQTRCLEESDEYNIPVEKVVQIPPGFDPCRFHQVGTRRRDFIRQKLGWMHPTVFAAGRLAPSKGFDLLISAFPAVLRRIPEARLVIATGSIEPSIEELAQLTELRALTQSLGISHRVIIMPCIDQDRLPDFYRAADIFVLSSRNEPFGMTAIEAMACGTPTIVTTHGGLWEQLSVGQDCILCDPLDAGELALAISSPLNLERIRQKLSRAGAATTVARFTWDHVADQFIETCVRKGCLDRSGRQDSFSRERLAS